ncbi:MAG: hypothetical protein P8016_15850 [Sedimentisphaerales bacterium]
MPWKVDIIQDFSSEEVLSLDDEARNNALKNVEDFYLLDLLQDKTKLAFKKIFSLSYPEYTTDIKIAAAASPKIKGELPEKASEEKSDEK